MDKKVNIFLPCDFALLDDNGKPSAIGIFDKLKLSPNSKILLNFCVVGQVVLNEEGGYLNKKTIEIKLFNEKDEEISSAKMPTDAGNTKLFTAGFIARFALVQISSKGIYKFKVFVDGDKCSEEFPLEIV